MEKYVFISYSSNDKLIADAICHFLEENAILCWMAPRDIMPGSTWAGAIIKAIRECAAMLLIYSKNSNDSSQVANEVDKAFSNGKPIIPFMMDSTPLNDDFDYYLSRKHWLVAYPDYRERFTDLLKVVSKLVSPRKNSGMGEMTSVSIPGNAPSKKRSNSLSNQSIKDKVIAIVADTLCLDEDEVYPSSSLGDLGADSLDAVDLIMKMEKEFDLRISDDNVLKIRTVGDIIRYVEANR